MGQHGTNVTFNASIPHQLINKWNDGKSKSKKSIRVNS